MGKRRKPSVSKSQNSLMTPEQWNRFLLNIYLILLTWVVIFKARLSMPVILETRIFNFIPFYYNVTSGAGIPFLEAILNVLVFIPLGLLLSMHGVKRSLAVLWGFILSFCYEGIQLLLAIGTADVTDLITNTAGCAIGLFIYAFLRIFFKDRVRLNRGLRVIMTDGIVALAVVAIIFQFL